jgi:hypothetical protein
MGISSWKSLRLSVKEIVSIETTFGPIHRTGPPLILLNNDLDPVHGIDKVSGTILKFCSFIILQQCMDNRKSSMISVKAKRNSPILQFLSGEVPVGPKRAPRIWLLRGRFSGRPALQVLRQSSEFPKNPYHTAA